MPKILITGNGFDLNFGLPTSYNDFIKILNYIRKENCDTDFKSIYSNSLNYTSISKKFKPFNFDIEKIKILNHLTSNNSWYQFFSNEYKIESWIDFETKIEYVLQLLFYSINQIKKEFDKGSKNTRNINGLRYNLEIFKNNIETAQVLKKFNIINFTRDYTITLNKEYLIEKHNFYIDIDVVKIAEKLNDELIEFKKIFNLYFEVFVYPFYDNLLTKIDTKAYFEIDRHYTFNYTSTFDKMYVTKTFEKNTKYLHGKIDCETNSIVLGIDEIPNENIDKRYYLPFTKYFQKLNNDTDYGFIKEYEHQKRERFFFYFLGHSLDTSDRDYINEVFDFINSLDSRNNKIIIIYHSAKSKAKLLINLLNIRGKKDILSLMKSDILVFYKINSKEIKISLKENTSRVFIPPSTF